MKNRQTSCEEMIAIKVSLPSAVKRAFGGLMTIILIAVLLSAMSLRVVAEASDTDVAATAGTLVEVGIPVEEHPELFISRSMPTHGEGKIAVFLIDFPNDRNSNSSATAEYYDKLYFSGGLALPDDFDVESVANFFQTQSYGKLNLSGQVFDWYTAKHERSYYEDRKEDLIMEAAEYYRTQGVDFSKFDGDGDGVLDAVAFHFAGDYSDRQKDPWYSGVCISDRDGLGHIGNLQFKTMVQVAEQDNRDGDIIPTICHELMHTLGMPDLYSQVSDLCRVTFDLMVSLNDNAINPYFKILLGWIDRVRVITEDTEDIRLSPYGETGSDAVIVANTFNGFFDEFYVVAYRANDGWLYSGKTPAIWHIDARLTEDGTAFKYNNLNYLPRATAHNQVGMSEYPFLEEISADPTVNLWLDISITPDMVGFSDDSVFGPNHVPSSDTHDGKYSGIKIENFTEHNDEEYLTFDVSFVEDTTSPAVITRAFDLEYQQTIALDFSEFIYAGEFFGDIKITNFDGTPINATIHLPKHSHQQMEITFADESYKDGYVITIPQGGLRDSSNNPIEMVTLTSSKEHSLFPIRSEQLPNAENYSTGEPFFFHDENGLTAISGLSVKHKDTYINGIKLKLTRLDREGNVVFQKIIDNPFYDSNMEMETGFELVPVYVCQTDDGCYIIAHTLYGICDRMFCIDGNGNVKWANDQYFKTGSRFYMDNAYGWDNGLITTLYNGEYATAVHISSATGNITEKRDASRGLKLSTGKLLSGYGRLQGTDGIWYTQVVLIDPITHKSEVWGKLRCYSGDNGDEWIIRDASVNDDGTIMLFCETYHDDKAVFLLDAELNVIDSLSSLKASSAGGYEKMCWITNDGFCWIIRTYMNGHGDNQFRVYRYDRYLNLMWKANITAGSIYYFTSESGDLFSYKSSYDSDLRITQSYIEYYGSEDAYRTEHIHNLIHKEAVAPTCQKEGMREYWYCIDCKCSYSDEGQTPLTDMESLILPKTGHTAVIIPAVAPTCTAEGLLEGSKCSVCGEILIAQETVAAKGHLLVNGICSVCGQYIQIPGDLNEDGIINTSDVVLLRRYIAGGYGVTINEKTADVNADGNLNTTDVVLIRRFIAGGYGVVLKIAP